MRRKKTILTSVLLAACCAFPFYASGQPTAQTSSANGADGMSETERRARQGDADAQLKLGLMYALGKGMRQDYAQALHWLELAAKQGHASAQFNLGVMYDEGKGVRQDHAQARHWYELAAKQGHASAQSNLGLMYA